MFTGISERAAQIAAIGSFGWREGVLARLVVTEGVIIGMAGSLPGAAARVAIAAISARVRNRHFA